MAGTAGPDTRTMPIPPMPGGVATAQMVSFVALIDRAPRRQPAAAILRVM
jgi:hypothetical protein